MADRIFKSFERSIRRTGKVKTSVLLNAAGEQMRALGDAHDNAAEHYGKKSHGYHIFRQSARTLRKMANIIEMHALYHIGDPPQKLDASTKRALLGKKRSH